MRKPAVAGIFYPGDGSELDDEVDSFLSKAESRHNAIAGVSPHAGYTYSGQTAAWTFANIAKKETIVIVGPDHTGAAVGQTAIYFEGGWKTPLGEVQIDSVLSKELQDVGVMNKAAHLGEHSIEVQLPFIQKRFPNSKIVPIMLGDQTQSVAERLGKRLAEFDCMVVASSDFSHYVPVAKAAEEDNYAINALEKLDVDDFYRRVMEKRLSACGVGPIAVAATFAKEKGATRGVLLNYTTSAYVTGDAECVGYASVVFL